MLKEPQNVNMFMTVVKLEDLVDYLYSILNTLVLVFLKKSIVIYGDLLLFYQ